MRLNKISTLAVLLMATTTAAAGSAHAFPGFKKAKPAPVEAAPAPPPVAAPLPPPEIKFASRFVDSAAAYGGYMERAGAIRPTYADGSGVQTALRTGESFEPKQLQQGMIAYGALVAMQDPAFVAQMRIYASDPRSREIVATQLMADPNYVAGVPGVAGAAGRVVAALAAQGTQVNAAGVAVKQSAYDIQHQSWSKATVVDRDGRLSAAKSLSATPLVVSEAERSRFVGIPTGPAISGAPISGPYTPSVARALAMAGMAVMGMAGEDHADQISRLLVDDQDAFCLNMSKLNLYQCLAVAKPHYEDVFCLGQHVLLDTAQCVMKSAGTPLSPTPIGMAATATAVVASASPAPGGAMTSPRN